MSCVMKRLVKLPGRPLPLLAIAVSRDLLFLTLGFLGHHDDSLPFQVQESSVASLNSYSFLEF